MSQRKGQKLYNHIWNIIDDNPLDNIEEYLFQMSNEEFDKVVKK